MSWNEEEMVKGMAFVNLTLDDAMRIMTHLTGFNITLYKEILQTNPENCEDIKGRVISDLSMVVHNNELFNKLHIQVKEYMQESVLYRPLCMYIRLENAYAKEVLELYEEAENLIGEIKNEE